MPDIESYPAAATVSNDQMTRGLQAWAGTNPDGDFGPLSIEAAWKRAGRPKWTPPVEEPPHAPLAMDAASKELDELWRSAKLLVSWQSRIASQADAIAQQRHRYEPVAAKTGVPWWVIGVIHSMECGLRFDRHLHNGDPLTARTVQVPRGRPTTGSAPFTWEESAVDAIRYDGLYRVPAAHWSQPGLVLDQFERFNGLGYRKKGVPSPYLWSGTGHYVKGKYVADGRYDPNAVSKQVGVAALLKVLGVFFD